MILSLNNVFFLFLFKHIASGTLTFKKKRTLIFHNFQYFFNLWNINTQSCVITSINILIQMMLITFGIRLLWKMYKKYIPYLSGIFSKLCSNSLWFQSIPLSKYPYTRLNGPSVANLFRPKLNAIANATKVSYWRKLRHKKK
jgi:hypothetical protein